MRRLLLAIGLILGLMLGLTAPVTAQDSRGNGIENAIQSQLDAFLADDYATAFSFASPAIQGLFGNADNFGLMVRQGYPMVWRPGDVRYLGRKTVGGRTLQNVLIRDRTGAVHVLEYEMIATEKGWQINGVRLIEPPEVGA
jgi:Domain of unknown function (DUF4864)